MILYLIIDVPIIYVQKLGQTVNQRHRLKRSKAGAINFGAVFAIGDMLLIINGMTYLIEMAKFKFSRLSHFAPSYWCSCKVNSTTHYHYSLIIAKTQGDKYSLSLLFSQRWFHGAHFHNEWLCDLFYLNR